MKEKNKQHVWKDYFSMLQKAGLPWFLMAVCFALSMLKAIMSLALANQISIAFADFADIKDAVPELWKLIGVLIVGIAASVAGMHLQGIVGAQVDRNMQRYAVSNVLYLKTKDLEENDTRNFITRLTEDTCKNSPFLIELAINEIPRIYYIVAAIIAVSKIGQPTLTGAMFLLIPCIIVLSFVSGKITFANRNKVQTRLASVTAKLAEKIENIELIKTYSNEDKEIQAGNDVLDELGKVRKEGALVDHVNKYIKNMIWFIDVAIMVIPPTLLMFKGVIDRNIYYSYILLVSRFETYIREHLTVWIYLKEAQGATRRLSSVLNMENEKSVSLDTEFSAGDIEFRNVSFAYGEENVLNDVSFVIEKGRKTGIVGLSGSGKSTILNLIEKFYEPDEGKILIGGKDINEFDYNGYRSHFAYLPQNAPCMSGSVREMLNYSSTDCFADEELLKVLKDVMLYDDIMELGGLDYQIGHNGENLSGGQRQKLGIARMLLSDSEYVLLDEATSALDPEATAAIQKKIDEKCKGKTLVVVAHDLSTIENADKVLVFDKGTLLKEGTHRELKETLPLYRDLVKGDR